MINEKKDCEVVGKHEINSIKVSTLFMFVAGICFFLLSVIAVVGVYTNANSTILAILVVGVVVWAVVVFFYLCARYEKDNT